MLKISCFVLFALLTVGVDAAESGAPLSPDSRFVVGELLALDDFDVGLDRWKPELEKGGSITARDGQLEIDVPGGATVWLKTSLTGPLLISYDAVVVAAGGPNDRVSDLNCFWMAHDMRSPDDIFATERNGRFAEYDRLACYYVGYGGNANTTTRFRRYVGEQGNRPLRDEHNLSAKEFLLVPNQLVRVHLVAAGSTIGYYANGRRVFAYDDPKPSTSGWFAFRTVTNHLRVKNFRVYRLHSQLEAGREPRPGPAERKLSHGQGG